MQAAEDKLYRLADAQDTIITAAATTAGRFGGVKGEALQIIKNFANSPVDAQVCPCARDCHCAEVLTTLSAEDAAAAPLAQLPEASRLKLNLVAAYQRPPADVDSFVCPCPGDCQCPEIRVPSRSEDAAAAPLVHLPKEQDCADPTRDFVLAEAVTKTNGRCAKEVANKRRRLLPPPCGKKSPLSQVRHCQRMLTQKCARLEQESCEKTERLRLLQQREREARKEKEFLANRCASMLLELEASVKNSAEHLGKALLQLFTCPVTMRALKDPQIGPDGHTYEADAIKEWLLDHPTSPLTRDPMSSELLRPNRVVQEALALIAEHVAEVIPDAGQPPPPHLRSPEVEEQEAEAQIESLGDAIYSGNREVALELLGRRLPDKVINVTFDLDSINVNLLQLAIIAEMPDVAAALLHRVDFRGTMKLTGNGLTALHLAAFYGFAPLCDELCDFMGVWQLPYVTRQATQLPVKSTNERVQVDIGLTAADLARMRGHESLARRLTA